MYCMINLFNIGHIKSAVGLVGSSSLQNWPTTSFDAFLPFRPMVSKPYLWRSTGTHPVSFHVTCRRGTGLLFQRLQHLSQHFGRGWTLKWSSVMDIHRVTSKLLILKTQSQYFDILYTSKRINQVPCNIMIMSICHEPSSQDRVSSVWK